jgi:hypothetical protein
MPFIVQHKTEKRGHITSIDKQFSGSKDKLRPDMTSATKNRLTLSHTAVDLGRDGVQDLTTERGARAWLNGAYMNGAVEASDENIASITAAAQDREDEVGSMVIGQEDQDAVTALSMALISALS